jgi:Helix-turn-helix domain
MGEATAEQMEEIKGMLALVLERLDRPAETGRENYSVEEAATILGRSCYTVREWCRMGRIHATKRQQKRGGVELWNVAASELRRYRDEGLLPLDPRRNA